MNLKFLLFFTFNTLNVNAIVKNTTIKSVPVKMRYKEFDEHTVVTDGQAFPYVVALLKKSSYLSAGALIDESWVLTDADSLFFTREAIKVIRVRLGSINYKKGGTVVPIKLFQIHPYFDDRKPLFDVALIMLANPVRLTPRIYPVRLRNTPKNTVASHFIVTSWSGSLEPAPKTHKHIDSMETIKRRRMLSVTHLHPSDPDDCTEDLREMGINDTETVMCLDPGVKSDPCVRDVGAPVVLNGILWGIISSWKLENCNVEKPGSTLVTLISESHISSWLHANIHGHSWKYEKNHLHPSRGYEKDMDDYNIDDMLP